MEVAAAEFDANLTFRVNTSMHATNLTGFLTESPPAPDRLPLLGCLLDAVSGRMKGGPGILLITDSDLEAAHWIAAVSKFTNPWIANKISWSTFTRADDLLDDLVSDLDVVATPRKDAQSVSPEGTDRIVIDLAEEPEGDLNEPWQLQSGQTVAQSPWSVVALSVMARDPELIAQLLRDLESSDVRHPDPAVPLVLRALTEPELLPEQVRQAIEHRYRILFLQSRMNISSADAAEYAMSLAQHDNYLEAVPPPPTPPSHINLTTQQRQELLQCLYRRRQMLLDDHLLGLLGLSSSPTNIDDGKWTWRPKARFAHQSISADEAAPLHAAVRGAATLILLCHTTGEEQLINECAETGEALARILNAEHPVAPELVNDVDSRLPPDIQKLYVTSGVATRATASPPLRPTVVHTSKSIAAHDQPENLHNICQNLMHAVDPIDFTNSQLRRVGIDVEQAALLTLIARMDTAESLSALLLAASRNHHRYDAASPDWQTLGYIRTLLDGSTSAAALLRKQLPVVVGSLSNVDRDNPWLAQNAFAHTIVTDFVADVITRCGTGPVAKALETVRRPSTPVNPSEIPPPTNISAIFLAALRDSKGLA